MDCPRSGFELARAMEWKSCEVRKCRSGRLDAQCIYRAFVLTLRACDIRSVSIVLVG